MVDLMFHPTKVLFLDIAFLYYYTNLNSPIICCLSSGDMYLFLVLLFHYQHHHFESLLQILTCLLFYQLFCYQLHQQFLLLFFKLLFLKQFLLHPLQTFQHYQEIFDHIYYLNFYLCFQQKTKIHILSHIFYSICRFN